jgi:leader peptidase (prepilin peptidase)/N-methyltransferase
MLLAQPGGRAHTHVFWLGLAGIAVLLAQIQQVGWFILPSLALFAALVVVVTFDVEFFLIPDGPLLFLFGTGVATTLVAAPRELPARLGAALAAWAFLRLAAWGYENWRGFAGLGLGDAKLFSIAGLWLGFQGLPGCLLVAAFSGLVSAAILLRSVTSLEARQPIPFGPHLALGLWLAWSVGPLENGPMF